MYNEMTDEEIIAKGKPVTLVNIAQFSAHIGYLLGMGPKNIRFCGIYGDPDTDTRRISQPYQHERFYYGREAYVVLDGHLPKLSKKMDKIRMKRNEYERWRSTERDRVGREAMYKAHGEFDTANPYKSCPELKTIIPKDQRDKLAKAQKLL